MSKEHQELTLWRSPIFGEWQAVRVSKHGAWNTDKWPLQDVRQALMGALLSDDAWDKAVSAMHDHVTGLKDIDLDTLQTAAEVAIKAAVEAVTTDE